MRSPAPAVIYLVAALGVSLPAAAWGDISVLLAGPGSLAYEANTVDNPNRYDLQKDGNPEVIFQPQWDQIRAIGATGGSLTEIWSYTFAPGEVCGACGQEPENWQMWLVEFVDAEPGTRDALIQFNDYDFISGFEWSGIGLVSTATQTGTLRQVIADRRFEACVDVDGDGLWEVLLAQDFPGGGWEIWGYESATATEDRSRLSAQVNLKENVPNPFNPSTRIRFTLQHPGQTKVEFFDVRGRRVYEIDLGYLDAGEHECTWNGRDRGGRSLSSGVYSYSVWQGDVRSSRKLTLLR